MNESWFTHSAALADNNDLNKVFEHVHDHVPRSNVLRLGMTGIKRRADWLKNRTTGLLPFEKRLKLISNNVDPKIHV